jgi:hypothetical protein
VDGGGHAPQNAVLVGIRIDELIRRMDERARRECDVRYYGTVTRQEVWGSADFDPSWGPHGAAIVLRRGFSDDPDGAFVELLTMAYALGHLRSWQSGGWSSTLVEAREQLAEGKDVGEAHVAAYLAEETRAWEFASRELAQVGFTDWQSFESRRAISIDLATEFIEGSAGARRTDPGPASELAEAERAIAAARDRR